MPIRYGLIILALIAGTELSGCAAGVKAGTAAVSTLGAWWSYKAASADPVAVTTLARECVWFKYVSMTCDEWAVLSAATKKAIADNNRLGVELCGVERTATVCP